MLKLQKPTNKQTKYRFICKAGESLTKYNEAQNRSVADTCMQDPKFDPKLSCSDRVWQHDPDKPDSMCPYLEIRKIG